MSGRILDDGCIVFPRRGKPPACPDGYDSDPGNPYVFHPIKFDCEYRTRRKIKPHCNECKRTKMWCTKIESYMTYFGCMKCRNDSNWLNTFRRL